MNKPFSGKKKITQRRYKRILRESSQERKSECKLSFRVKLFVEKQCSITIIMANIYSLYVPSIALSMKMA